MSFEFQSQDKVPFVDIIPSLSEGEEIVLTRTDVTSVSSHRQYQNQPVHYEGLERYVNVNNNTYTGDDITDAFFDVTKASDLLVDRTITAHYPRLQVIHDSTYNAAEEIVDVARLVQQGRLPIYSSNARSTRGGKMFTVGVKSLIYDLARNVGVNPNRSVVVKKGGPVTIDEAGLDVQQMVGQKTAFQEVNSTPGSTPINEDSLILLQMEVMKQFKERSPHPSTKYDTRPMVSLSLTEIPHIKFLVNSMINVVEERHLKLMLARDFVETGMDGYVFSIVGDNLFAPPTFLSAERSFGMAAYRGYLAVESTIRNM